MMSDNDIPAEQTTPTHRVAARETRGSSSYTTIAPRYEERLIILAQGLQYLNHQLPETYRVPEYLQRRLRSRVRVAADGTASFTSRRQGVHFIIRKITRKDEFKDALQTQKAHVIYGGHARFGRGPCFGPNDAPGENWGVGTDPTANGIFCWGYPYMLIDITDILDHQYTVYPLLAGSDKPPRSDCHPDIVERYRRIRKYPVNQFNANLRQYIGGTNPPTGLVGPAVPPSPSDEYWGYATRSGRRPSKIVLHAHWNQSMSSPLDLGAADMRCRVFCHFGCSSFRHNYRVLRFMKNWRRQGEVDRFAYWTTAPPPHVNLPSRWIYYVLKYPRWNAFQPWRPSLRWALGRTRAYIRRTNGRYNVI
jgi:hypothetical protein